MIRALILISTFGAMLLNIASISAATVYVYQDANGTRIISDHINRSKGLTLIKKYSPKSTVRSLKHRSYSFSAGGIPTPKASKFDKTIFQIADQYKQDRALIKAIIQIESSFNPMAVSSQGAQGLMQLMPFTAKSYNIANPFNAADNIRGGTRYLTHLMKTYSNNVKLALAAYNAGETAVNKYNGIPPYPETQRYVKLVLALHKIYQKNPAAIYG